MWEAAYWGSRPIMVTFYITHSSKVSKRARYSALTGYMGMCLSAMMTTAIIAMSMRTISNTFQRVNRIASNSSFLGSRNSMMIFLDRDAILGQCGL